METLLIGIPQQRYHGTADGRSRVIDSPLPSGIIPCATGMCLSKAGETDQKIWLRSSMVEQLTLNQLVEGSNPPGVTNKKYLHPELTP